MLQLLRRGYAFDLALFLIVTLVVGAGTAAGTALAIDAAFGDAVSHLIGQAGEYDVIVHLREESGDGSFPVLAQLLASRWPGVQVKRGVRVAGNDNVLINFGQQHRRADVFETLPSLLSDITGYNGHTWVVEPSLTISGVRGAVADRLVEELAALPGVLFPFRHGSHVTVVLESPGAAQMVAGPIEALLARHRVAELRLPEGSDPEAVVDALWASLPEGERERWADISGSSGSAGGTEALLRDVARIVDLYAPRAYLSPGAPLSVGDRVAVAAVDGEVLQPGAPLPSSIGESYVLLEVTAAGSGGFLGRIVEGGADRLAAVSPGRFAGLGYRVEAGHVGAPVGTVTVESPRDALETAAEQVGLTVQRLEELAQRLESLSAATLDTLIGWIEAVLNVEDVQRQVQGVQALLNGGEEGSASRQALIAALLSALAQDGRVPVGEILSGVTSATNGQGDGAGSPTDPWTPGGGAGETPSLQWLKDELAALRREMETALSETNAAALAELADRLQDSVPALADGVMIDALRRYDAYAGHRAGWGPTVELLVPASVKPEDIAAGVRQAAGVSPLVATFESGILNPNPRASLLQILAQVRQTLAGIIALGIAAFVLWADGSTLLQAARLLGRLPGARRGRGPSRGLPMGTRPGGTPSGRAWRRRGAEGAAFLGWGALLGLLIVPGLYRLAGGDVPGLTDGAVLLLGAAMGAVTAALAGRISPVNEDELTAGAACGLTAAQIMREIVVPEGRPGFLMLVNRWRSRGR